MGELGQSPTKNKNKNKTYVAMNLLMLMILPIGLLAMLSPRGALVTVVPVALLLVGYTAFLPLTLMRRARNSAGPALGCALAIAGILAFALASSVSLPGEPAPYAYLAAGWFGALLAAIAYC